MTEYLSIKRNEELDKFANYLDSTPNIIVERVNLLDDDDNFFEDCDIVTYAGKKLDCLFSDFTTKMEEIEPITKALFGGRIPSEEELDKARNLTLLVVDVKAEHNCAECGGALEMVDEDYSCSGGTLYAPDVYERLREYYVCPICGNEITYDCETGEWYD